MRFFSSLAYLLAASVVVASPITNSASAAAAAVPRSSGPLCEVGVPCWMQKLVSDSSAALEALVDVVVADISIPVNNVTVQIDAQASALGSAAAYVQGAVVGLATQQATELEAAVVAAIAPLTNQIYLSLNQILATVTDVEGVVKASAAGCVSAVINIEAVVGPCTNPNIPVPGS